MDSAATVHRMEDDAVPSIHDTIREMQDAEPGKRYKRGDRVLMPTHRIAEIRARSAEDALAWADRLGGGPAYRMRFLDDDSVAQFRAGWLEEHCGDPLMVAAETKT